LTKGSVIFALDGVLTKSNSRPADGENIHCDQRALERAMAFQPMIKLCRQLAELNSITIISPRPFSCYELSRLWIRDHRIEFDMLLLKQTKAEQSVADTKVDLIKMAVDDVIKPWLLIDNDPDVLRRVKGLGVQGMLVQV
jgi:hypothetical protein